MELIHNWKDAWKMTSVQLATAGSLLAVADQVMPTLQAVIPPAAYAILFSVVAVARVILQPKLNK
ncbi:hypothetical protein D9M71_240570 [compost metagenome]